MTDRRRHLLSLLITAACGVVVVFLLTMCRLNRHMPPPPSRQPAAEMAAELPEFVDFLEPAPQPGEPAQPYAPEPQQSNSRPAPATSPTPPKDKPQGPTQEQIEAEVRRRAQQGIADAFKNNAEGEQNTTASGREKGDTGTPSGTASNVAGVGSGSVGGGWIMPTYEKVKSVHTGSIELRATIGPDGAVTAVEQIGGKAPAGADPALVARCIAEVRRRRFTRHDTTPPPTATARITYIFR